MNPLIIFDCDGVLVDSERIASAVFAEHLTSAGYPQTQAECMERFTGLSLSVCKVIIEQQIKASLPVDFFVELQRETYKRFSEALQPVDGVVAVLDFLRENGWDCCVASSGSHEKMAVSLAKTGLQKYFDGRVFSAVDVVHGKPAPDLFLLAAQSVGYVPEDCIVVEDSGPGVMAALAAGMRVCTFGADYKELAGAVRFGSMSELPSILTAMREQIFLHRERQ
jgi:HAD superfamily hydrolase (TIGR01509 family)